MLKITSVPPSVSAAGAFTANLEAPLPGHAAQALAARPTSLPAPSAGLGNLPPDISREFATHFVIGSRELTALSRTSKALHATFVGRARADRKMDELITALDARIDDLGAAADLAQAVSTVMADIGQAHIETRSHTTQADRPANAAISTIALPDEQKVRLLSRLHDFILQHLPGQLDSVATLAPIAARLRTQARTFKRHAHRHAVLERASTLLPRCLPRQPQQLAPAARSLFRQFEKDCNAILSNPPLGTAPVTYAECATTLGLLAENIRLLPDPKERAAQWQALFDDRRAGSGDERVLLFEDLIAAAGYLAPQTACQDALGKILAKIPGHAAPAREQLLRCVLANPVRYLGRFPADGFDTLVAVAAGLPEAERGRCIVALANGLLLQQPTRQKQTFDTLVETVQAIDSAPAEQILYALANAVKHLPAGIDRGAAIESVVRGIGLLDPGAMHRPLGNVISSMFQVPQQQSRDGTMAIVVDLLATLPTESRGALLCNAGHLLLVPSLAPPMPEHDSTVWLSQFTRLLQLVTQQPRREAFATLGEFNAVAYYMEPCWRPILAPEIAAARERTKEIASGGRAASR